MESPVQTAARLLTALEELTEQEGMYLRGGYYDVAAETRQRAAPLVNHLTRLAGEAGVDELQPRVAVVIRHSDGHAAFLREKLEQLGVQIRQTDQARGRVAQVAPAYARAPGAALPRFQAAG